MTHDRDRPRLVPISSYHAHLDLRYLLQYHKIPVEPKRCYDNATRLAVCLPAIEYVEGEVWVPEFGHAIPHAWNEIGDFHFDLTWEVHLKIPPKAQYFQIIRGSMSALKQQKLDPNRAGDLLTQLINQKLADRPWPEA